MKIRFRRVLVTLIIVLVILLLGVKSYGSSMLSPVNRQDIQKRSFIVYKGERVGEISKRLEKEGLIRSAFIFEILTKKTGQAYQIQAGEFKLSPAMRTEEILDQLTRGVLSKWVTLIEGWRVEEMAAEFNSKFNSGELGTGFLEVAKEGYMFPDTYLFKEDVTASEIAQVMRENFDKKYSSDVQNKIKFLGLTPAEGVILASIVEREARSGEARRMVASILLKRFKMGMGLNADATVQYALVPAGLKNPPAGGWWKRHLTRSDLKINSPYNTYIYAGLPPAPIANPSLSALTAVAGADPSVPYLYYYHDSEGRSHYGKTLDEHNENIARNP